MSNKKEMVLCFCSIILMIAVLFQSRHHIFSAINQYFPARVTQLKNLTSEEKVKDFKYCYESLCNGHPAIKDYEEVFGINMVDKYDSYNECIKSTIDNYEFFCVMNSFMREVPSFHTDLVFPEKNAYTDLHCFGGQEINADRDTVALSLSWNETIKDSAEKYQDAAFYPFEYIDGEYWLVDHDGDEDVSLVDVDGISIDEYIMSSMSSYGLWYDGKYNKLYHKKIVFNDRYGKRVTIKTRDRDGAESSRTIYASLYAETAYWVKGIEIQQETIEEDFTIDQNGDICHITLNNMLLPTYMELSSALKNNKQDKI